MLQKGSTGDAVTELQTKLNILGYGIIADGDFGPATETAVKRFQAGNNLEADGIAESMTLAALEQAIKNMDQPKQEKHYVQKYYDFLKEKGININETRFDDTITRGEVFVLMARVMGYKE